MNSIVVSLASPLTSWITRTSSCASVVNGPSTFVRWIVTSPVLPTTTSNWTPMMPLAAAAKSAALPVAKSLRWMTGRPARLCWTTCASSWARRSPRCVRSHPSRGRRRAPPSSPSAYRDRPPPGRRRGRAPREVVVVPLAEELLGGAVSDSVHLRALSARPRTAERLRVRVPLVGGVMVDRPLEPGPDADDRRALVRRAPRLPGGSRSLASCARFPAPWIRHGGADDGTLRPAPSRQHHGDVTAAIVPQ